VADSGSLSTGAILGIVLGIVVPVVCVLFVLMAAALVAMLGYIVRKRRLRSEWEINYDELDMGEQLGVGGFGEVRKAMWKGTEVAVKTIVSVHVTKEMERNFQEEVRVMTALRHPNVVLFMAASTKAPKLCIVMECMSWDPFMSCCTMS
jgi:type III secretory pathway component EscV